MPDVFIADSKSKEPTQNQDVTPVTPSPVKNDPTSDPLLNPPAPAKNRGLHLFSAMGINPEDVYFRNQEKNEKILLFLRKARITNIRWMVLSIFLLVLPVILFPFIKIDQSFFLPARFSLFFISFYYLLIFSYIYISFVTWYFNIALVTNFKVIDIEFSGLIYKNIAATKLSLVQDVSFTQIGVIMAFFDFGDVLVQTAGTFENFTFDSVPEPENVVHIIEDLIGKNGTV